MHLTHPLQTGNRNDILNRFNSWNEDMKLENKIAVITGGASGIGKASALLFAREGAGVVIADVHEKAGIEVVKQIEQEGGKASFFRADVSAAEDCRSMIEYAEKTFGSLQILFNNAGIMHADDHSAESTPEEIWNRTMEINAKGVFLCCKYGIPALKRAGGGSVINTASFVSLMGAATSQVAYTASKGAVLSFSRELAVIHAREGIRVNALCPGPLKTDLLMKILDTDEKKERRLRHIPMGRFGEAEEMAKAALFLASDDSSYITGSNFMVDGGITAAYVTPEEL
jgi:NAD(P)-dependent dehydrogenase (short-subunit alcohol dehydrogenase family)